MACHASSGITTPAALLRLAPYRIGQRCQGRPGQASPRLGEDDAGHLRPPVARPGRVHPGRRSMRSCPRDSKIVRTICGLFPHLAAFPDAGTPWVPATTRTRPRGAALHRASRGARHARTVHRAIAWLKTLGGGSCSQSRSLPARAAASARPPQHNWPAPGTTWSWPPGGPTGWSRPPPAPGNGEVRHRPNSSTLPTLRPSRRSPGRSTGATCWSTMRAARSAWRTWRTRTRPTGRPCSRSTCSARCT